MSAGTADPRLHPRIRRVDIAVTAAEAAGIDAAVLAVYALLPLDDGGTVSVVLTLGALAAVLAAVLTWQVRAVLRAQRPALRAARALNTAVVIHLTAFSALYVALATADPAAFTQHLGRVDALYFAVTVLATVGFGDIAPATTTARVAVTVQMILNLVLLGVAVRFLAGAARLRLSRSRPDGPGTAAQTHPEERP